VGRSLASGVREHSGLVCPSLAERGRRRASPKPLPATGERLAATSSCSSPWARGAAPGAARRSAAARDKARRRSHEGVPQSRRLGRGGNALRLLASRLQRGGSSSGRPQDENHLDHSRAERLLGSDRALQSACRPPVLRTTSQIRMAAAGMCTKRLASGSSTLRLACTST